MLNKELKHLNILSIILSLPSIIAVSLWYGSYNVRRNYFNGEILRETILAIGDFEVIRLLTYPIILIYLLVSLNYYKKNKQLTMEDCIFSSLTFIIFIIANWCSVSRCILID
jgi:hypothetical protein